MEETVVISSADLVEYADLSRKKTEIGFRKGFLLRKGAGETDEHVQALAKQLGGVEEKISPIEKKMACVDILTVVPNRAEIISLTNEIEQHPKEKLDEALKSKSGDVYGLLKKRASYTKSNYENREQIARLTILLNSLPRKEAENLKTLVESHATEVIDVSSLEEGRQKDLVGVLGRLGISAYVSGSKLSLEKESGEGEISWPGEVEKRYTDAGGLVKSVWVAKENEAKWEHNEQRISTVSRRIQALIATSQAQELTDAQAVEFEALQKEYIELRQVREDISSSDESVSVSLPLRADS